MEHNSLYLLISFNSKVMSDLSYKLEQIRLKTRKLCEEFEKLRIRNVFLESENLNLINKLSKKQNKIEELKSDKELIINAKSMNELGLNGKEGRYKINELVRGIDKCIAHLNE